MTCGPQPSKLSSLQLFAVRAALGIAGTLTVVSDCKSLIRVARNIQRIGRCADEPFISNFQEQSRLILRWARARHIDRRYYSQATFDQELNKVADRVAKAHALQAAPIHPFFFDGVRCNLYWKRKWLPCRSG